MQFCLSTAIVILFCYAVASCLASIFHCNPVRSFWVIELRYSGCPTLERSVVIYSGLRSVSVAFDIIVILLPMKYVVSGFLEVGYLLISSKVLVEFEITS